MLVLSRRQDDKIVFPNLGISVEVLKIAGRSVRIGVEAPADVRVLRHELADKEGVGEVHTARMRTNVQSLDSERDSQESTRRHALVVEDDANESELLAAFLRLSGFDVDTASDGCDALDYLSCSRRRPDVVLLDMQMPRCDGASTISAIRENPAYSDLRVFAVSGRVPADMGVTVGPSGVDKWFRKPLNPQTLVTELHRDFDHAVK